MIRAQQIAESGEVASLDLVDEADGEQRLAAPVGHWVCSGAMTLLLKPSFAQTKTGSATPEAGGFRLLAGRVAASPIEVVPNYERP